MAAANGNGAAGKATSAGDVSHLVAGTLYEKCQNASPPIGGWFSVVDTATRLSLTFYAFYRFLLLRPFSLLYFAYGWNTLWYGRISGLLLTLCLPLLPFFLCAVELLKRIGEKMPWAEEDWKLKGPGRVFFVRPDAFIASLFWDFQLALSVFCGSFLQFGIDRDGLMHTWYDTICNKQYWLGLLDQVEARRPLQLATWDGRQAHASGPGPEFGSADLVSKINDSYLGIGDRVLKRGKASGGDFDTLADIQAILESDVEYAGKEAILSEFIVPDEAVRLSSDGFGQVHAIDIITMRTRAGVRVLNVLLWTDCEEWSSHSCTAGYIVDVATETVTAPTAWYSPYFARQKSNLLGVRLPGVKHACERAVAAHAASKLPWLTTVGWDAMLTPDGIFFFEGNVAAYRTPRRMFLTHALNAAFLQERGY